MKIYLMRHGKTILNSLSFIQGGGSNSALTKSGIKNTLKAKSIINKLDIQRVYTGDLGRQLQTFELIDNHYDHIIDSNLNEAHFGSFENQPIWYMYIKIFFKIHYVGSTRKLSINQIMDSVKLASKSDLAEGSSQILKRVDNAMSNILNSGLDRVLVISSGMYLETLIEKYNPDIKFMRIKNCVVYLLDTDNNYKVSVVEQ